MRESLTRGAVVALVALVLALRDAVAHVVHGDALPARAPELESAALPRRCKSGNHLKSNNSELQGLMMYFSLYNVCENAWSHCNIFVLF